MAHHSEPAVTNGRRGGAKAALEKRRKLRKPLALAMRPANDDDADAVAAEEATVILVGPQGDATLPAGENAPLNDQPSEELQQTSEDDSGEETASEIAASEHAAPQDGAADEPDQSALPPSQQRLSDPELIAILQQLSTTIDTAHQVLDEANALESSMAAGQPARHEPDGEDAAEHDTQEAARDPYADIVQEEEAAARRPYAPPYSSPPRSSSKSVTFAAIGACIFVLGGVAWVFHANPWLSDPTEGKGDSGLRREASLASPPASVRPDAAAPVSAPAGELSRTGPSGTPASAATQPAKGAAGLPIPLRIDLPVAEAGTEISLMVQGVPESATLSTGRNIGGGIWIVDFADAGSLTMTVPPGFGSQQVDIEVTFVKSDGKVPEARLIDVVIDPARAPRSPDGVTHAAGQAGTAPLVAASPLKTPREPAPGGASPTTVAVAAPTARPEAATVRPEPAAAPVAPKPQAALPKEIEAKLLARGDEMMKAGDIAGARLIYEHAARRGSRLAMTAMGKSFDPEHLAKLGVLGVKPDKEQAQAWYERASRTADR
ncbi:MAG: hypothetical protein VX871_05160 [Pseudomonadota bacterium]|nr:hypothetical protein [Pseudomonadota bacterium]